MTSRIIRTAGTALAAAALLPGASLAYQDLRSPDTRDAARAAERGSYQDLRMPDTRDAARPHPVVPSTPAVEPAVDTGGTDWGLVGIVGGALALMGVATLVVLGRRRAGLRASRAPIISG